MSRAHRARVDQETIAVPITDLPAQYLLVLIFQRLERIEAKMTEITQAVADLGSAVSGVTTRLADALAASQAAQVQAQAVVADLQTRVDALQADDDADKQAIADGLQQVADLNAQSVAAASDIEARVADLNALVPAQAPADNGGDVPPADGGDVPPADGGDVPPADGGDTPAA